jgi:hypothetical protein
VPMSDEQSKYVPGGATDVVAMTVPVKEYR